MDYLLTSRARRINGPFLRISLAIILAWIGALKFVDPAPLVGLLQASLAFLSFNAFVYLLGALEIVILKDLGLMAAAVNVIAMAPVNQPRRIAAQAVTA
jgi:uncharacterized membrane protein YkgB